MMSLEKKGALCLPGLDVMLSPVSLLSVSVATAGGGWLHPLTAGLENAAAACFIYSFGCFLRLFFKLQE